ncbi:MAG: hypothetical protein V2I35_12825 [Desulfocapsaceae bacterium]|jgi:hypothetical protein|nr:hypothetical protein [Desulfocapsaceae bacterium]
MKLIFVYNADSGLVNTVKDIGQKLFNPDNYGCLLCSLTHGTFREDPEWKAFRRNSSIEMQFLHRDEFERRYDMQMEYPLILRDDGDGLKVAFDKEQLAALGSLADLIQTVKNLEKQPE